jgi:hypothetical protein
MAGGFGDWGWVLVFFPLWFVVAPISFAVTAPLRRRASPRTERLLETSAVIVSTCCAAAIIMSLDCSSVIQISFLDQVCRAHDLQAGVWTGLASLL